MKILLTGGAGFIGSHIADKFLEQGHQVVVIDNLYTGRRENLNPQVKFYEVDVRDKQRIGDLFAAEKPEVLNHHAAQMDVRKSVSDPAFDADINILGLLNLMEAGVKNGLKKVIFASSGGAVYGDTQVIPTPETQPAYPASPYGVSKLTSELYLNYYFLTYGVRYIALRYGNVYGPRQNPHGEAGVVAIFTEKMLKQTAPVINGTGTQTRDFVYVKDVVRANTAALDYAENGIFNIGTGKSTDVNRIYATLRQLTGFAGAEAHGPAKSGEQQASLLDTALAGRKLDWQAETELEQGLADTVDYFRQRSI